LEALEYYLRGKDKQNKLYRSLKRSYGKDFAKKVMKILEELVNDENGSLTITDKWDCICLAGCPHKFEEYGYCRNPPPYYIKALDFVFNIMKNYEDEAAMADRIVAENYGLEIGKTYTIKEVLKKLKKGQKKR